MLVTNFKGEGMLKTIFTALIMIVALTGCSTKKEATTTKHKHSKTTMFQSVPPNKATLLQKGENKFSCINCGMNLPMFYKTNHSAKLNGNAKQYCSIHCLAKDIKEGKKVTHIKVVDTNTLRFIDASKAYYVLNSRKKGTMSAKSKYAFSTQEEAKAFAKAYGGIVGDFQMALALAKKD